MISARKSKNLNIKSGMMYRMIYSTSNSEWKWTIENVKFFKCNMYFLLQIWITHKINKKLLSNNI